MPALERDALPDSLRAGITLLFVGTAAGTHSARVGAYYAHPGNRFWRALHEIGLTPRLFAPHEYAQLLDFGIGFTDVAKRAHGMDHHISIETFAPIALAEKITTVRPRVVGFTSKRAASFWLEQPTKTISYGLQQPTACGGPAIFVLPSPSGAASRYWSIEPWTRLGQFVRDARKSA